MRDATPGRQKEKRTARAACMGAATSRRMTRTTFFGVLDLIFISDFYLRAVLEHLRTAHHLPDGRFASRGALVELFLFIPRPHSF
jgi:hypothetical protein